MKIKNVELNCSFFYWVIFDELASHLKVKPLCVPVSIDIILKNQVVVRFSYLLSNCQIAWLEDWIKLVWIFLGCWLDVVWSYNFVIFTNFGGFLIINYAVYKVASLLEFSALSLVHQVVDIYVKTAYFCHWVVFKSILQVVVSVSAKNSFFNVATNKLT